MLKINFQRGVNQNLSKGNLPEPQNYLIKLFSAKDHVDLSLSSHPQQSLHCSIVENINNSKITASKSKPLQHNFLIELSLWSNWLVCLLHTACHSGAVVSQSFHTEYSLLKALTEQFTVKNYFAEGTQKFGNKLFENFITNDHFLNEKAFKKS